MGEFVVFAQILDGLIVKDKFDDEDDEAEAEEEDEDVEEGGLGLMFSPYPVVHKVETFAAASLQPLPSFTVRKYSSSDSLKLKSVNLSLSLVEELWDISCSLVFPLTSVDSFGKIGIPLSGSNDLSPLLEESWDVFPCSDSVVSGFTDSFSPKSWVGSRNFSSSLVETRPILLSWLSVMSMFRPLSTANCSLLSFSRSLFKSTSALSTPNDLSFTLAEGWSNLPSSVLFLSQFPPTSNVECSIFSLSLSEANVDGSLLGCDEFSSPLTCSFSSSLSTGLVSSFRCGEFSQLPPKDRATNFCPKMDFKSTASARLGDEALRGLSFDDACSPWVGLSLLKVPVHPYNKIEIYKAARCNGIINYMKKEISGDQETGGRGRRRVALVIAWYKPKRFNDSKSSRCQESADVHQLIRIGNNTRDFLALFQNFKLSTNENNGVICDNDVKLKLSFLHPNTRSQRLVELDISAIQDKVPKNSKLKSILCKISNHCPYKTTPL
ncbi:hypothetical protein Ccrd_012066 [Cynara cardunculus var. scolymus]|uniref:Uncharacterized protein n=1 Tax=Cynara cardunculus var. scolymus TaxID=59895 RepID=A0A103YI63_CYNCS|nr:hypothetical protein Ccrd_012066 [Cynara cardunculus var. scolymus]